MRAWGVDAAEPVVSDADALRAELRDACRRGRPDGCRPVRRSPVVIGSLLAIAAVGATLLYFAVRNDGLARDRQAVDGPTDRTAAAAAPADVGDTAVGAGAMLETARERLQARDVRIGDASTRSAIK
jgi:hypothetical protein